MDILFKPRALCRAVTLAVTVMAGAGLPAAAQDLKSYAQKAVVNNPEVTARYNALRASLDEIDVARGAYYPRLDLLANKPANVVMLRAA